MKYLMIFVLFVMLACGNEIDQTSLNVNDPNVPAPKLTDGKTPAKVSCKKQSSEALSIMEEVPEDENTCCIDLATCPVGTAQTVSTWFNFQKFQRLEPNYSESNWFLYVNKDNGTWYLADETDPENTYYKACGLFGNFVSDHDYYDYTQGTGTLEMTYNRPNEHIYWTCVYDYNYSNEPHHNYVPDGQVRLMINCGVDGNEDLFDNEISYYFRSYGF